MEDIKICPVCSHEKFEEFIELKDYFLSEEDFKIDRCESCGLFITNPRPEEKDLGKYYESEEYLSHENENKSLFAKLYSIARNRNIKWKYNVVSKYARPGKKILDVGCATGELLAYFKMNKWEVTGIEPNDDAREFAARQNGIEVHEESALGSFAEQTFDIITLWHVMEHVPDLNKRMFELKKVLKKDGTLIIAIPNPESHDAKFYKNFWAAWDVPRHLYHFPQRTIKQLAEKFSFSLIETVPMKMDAIYISLLSDQYMNGKKKMIKSFLNGRKFNSQAKKDMNYSSLVYVFKQDN